MASIISSLEQDAAPEPKRWTAEQFVRFYESGELGGNAERFELLNGEILKGLGQNELHITSLRLAAEALRIAFGPGFDVSQQVPIRLGEFDRPEPDITVLRGTARDFDGQAPGTADVALLVEIADPRLDTARGQKVGIYARHGIAEYWIIDLRKRAVQVRRGPLADSEEWTETRLYAGTESIVPLHSASAAVAVEDLLPRPS
jgi:Uma2 family endonuclease